jgi:hypothetical protein
MSVPQGKPVNTPTFDDANLTHDLIPGRSVAGIAHLVNQTPQWHGSQSAKPPSRQQHMDLNLLRQESLQNR